MRCKEFIPWSFISITLYYLPCFNKYDGYGYTAFVLPTCPPICPWAESCLLRLARFTMRMISKPAVLTLSVRPSPQPFQISTSLERMVRLTWNKRDSMLDPQYGPDLCLVFKFKSRKCLSQELAVPSDPTDMDRKGHAFIGCWVHFMNDLDFWPHMRNWFAPQTKQIFVHLSIVITSDWIYATYFRSLICFRNRRHRCRDEWKHFWRPGMASRCTHPTEDRTRSHPTFPRTCKIRKGNINWKPLCNVCPEDDAYSFTIAQTYLTTWIRFFLVKQMYEHSRWLIVAVRPLPIQFWLIITWGPFYLNRLTLIRHGRPNHKVWYNITYPLQNFNGRLHRWRLGVYI